VHNLSPEHKDNAHSVIDGIRAGTIARIPNGLSKFWHCYVCDMMCNSHFQLEVKVSLRVLVKSPMHAI